MTESAPRIGCNRCKVPLCNVSKPKGPDLLSCPNCGVSDAYENVLLELGQRTADAFSRALYRPVPPRAFRFALLFRAMMSKPASPKIENRAGRLMTKVEVDPYRSG